MIFSDDEPDENLHFSKHFKTHKFYAVFVSTHAPSMSAYNQVERRMAPLWQD